MVLHLFEKYAFKVQRDKDIVVLLTTPKHYTLMADSVQWLSQSDYSIYISILVEFYQNLIETQN